MQSRALPVLILSLLLCNGCALIPLSALGSIVALGNSSVSQGRESYFWGKLHTAEFSRFDLARSAVKTTADELGMRARWPEKISGNRSEMAFVDDDGSQLGIRIDRRADQLVVIRLDVGWFGSEVTDRLFLARLRSHLPDPATRSVVMQ
jgi:hypothetical protein